MRSADVCSEDEVILFDVIAYIFVSREFMVLIQSYFISSRFVSIVASIPDSAASIFLPTMLLTLILSSIS